MRFGLFFMLCALSVSALMPAVHSPLFGHAHAASSMDKPLVLLRFNTRNIHYENQLFMAISRAVEAKPSVMFEVVSKPPRKQDPLDNAHWQGLAQQHAFAVMQSMNQMGVPQSRIRYTMQPMVGLTHDEIHIFVR